MHDDLDNDNFYVESDKDIVERAKSGKNIRDEPYDFKYLHEVMKQCAGS